MSEKQRKLYVSVLALVAVLLGGVFGSGCAIRKGDRSIVRPLALSKSQFKDAWYYTTTVVEAPFDAPGVFPGSQSSTAKIRWEITENYLYAFTTRPSILNSGSTVAPVAAWKIESHFTVRYRINYATGEPSNVISEDYADKAWYERPHFRVNWGRSAISDYSTSMVFYQLFDYVRKERFGTNVRPEDVRIQPDYMDFVSEELISPGLWSLIGKLNTGMPISDYRLKIRHSFRKVKKSSYTARPLQDDQFEKFGFFRDVVVVRNLERGFVDWGFRYYANRHNVANAAEIKKGTDKPKQIVYYLSPNFPEKFKSTAVLIGKDWNSAFQKALNRPGEDIFVVKDNADGLPEGQIRHMGDSRYNFLYWVDKPISFGLLGYGPSVTDFDTGEIVSGNAYFYGAVSKLVAERLGRR